MNNTISKQIDIDYAKYMILNVLPYKKKEYCKKIYDKEIQKNINKKTARKIANMLANIRYDSVIIEWKKEYSRLIDNFQ
jgi:hypothetical protein